MKVVLFCGGQGMRIREYSSEVPKPMIPVGREPILLHLMRYYAHYGHKDFVLCLGYQAHVIKDYFLRYEEARSNDFVLSGGEVRLLDSDLSDWTITFVDTGLQACVGERLMAVREHLGGEERFLANYADVLSGLHLPTMLDWSRQRDAVASFVTVKPPHTFHIIHAEHGGSVWGISNARETGMRINAGNFVLTQEVFDYMEPGDELVEAPFRRLVQVGRLAAYEYDGFWACMDTFKEKQLLDDIWERGDAPWEVWKRPEPTCDPEQLDPRGDGAPAHPTLRVVRPGERVP